MNTINIINEEICAYEQIAQEDNNLVLSNMIDSYLLSNIHYSHE
jgi:hypothetical protein